MIHLFAFSTTNQPWCNVLSRRWLSNCVAASYLCLTTCYGGPTATGELKGMRKTCHGRGEAPLSIPLVLPPSPGHQLLITGDSRNRNVNHPWKCLFFAGRASPLFGPGVKILCQKFLRRHGGYQRRLAGGTRRGDHGSQVAPGEGERRNAGPSRGMQKSFALKMRKMHKVKILKVSIKTSLVFFSPDCSPIWQGQPFQWTNSSVASSVAVICLNKGRHLAQPKAGAWTLAKLKTFIWQHQLTLHKHICSPWPQSIRD